MRICLTHARRAGFTLIEGITYLALFVFIAGLAFGAYYTMNQQTRSLNGSAADISRAMQAGERWRADIRLATAAMAEDKNTLRLTQKSGAVRYRFRNGAVWRELNETRPTLVLDGVHASAMQADRRQRVTAWSWELELKARRAKATVRPLFTFIAVPQTEVAP